MTEKMNRRNFLRVAAAAPATLGAGSVFAASTSGTPAPAHWDYEADVVVIGCGAAGLMAAVQAFDGGAKVVVFDKGMSPYHTSTRRLLRRGREPYPKRARGQGFSGGVR